MSFSGWVHIDVEEIVRSTDRALLVRLEDGSETWIPFSQMADPDDYQEGDGEVSIAVTEWLAKEKGLL